MAVQVVLASVAWLGERMFPKAGDDCSSSSSSSGGSQRMEQALLNAALERWLAQGPAGVRVAPLSEEERMEMRMQGVNWGEAEVEARIVLDMRGRAGQDLQPVVKAMKEGLKTKVVRAVAGSPTLLHATVPLQDATFHHLTSLLWKAVQVEPNSTLQVGSWGAFFKSGESLRLLKFDKHSLPEISHLSLITNRVLSISGKNLRGCDITAVVGGRSVAVSVFWQEAQRQCGRESEVLVATLPEDGVHTSDKLLMFADKTLVVQGHQSIVYRSEGRTVETEQGILTLSVTGLLRWMSTPVAVVAVLLAVVVESSRMRQGQVTAANILLVPMVCLLTWCLLHLLPPGAISCFKDECNKMWHRMCSARVGEGGVTASSPFWTARAGADGDLSDDGGKGQELRQHKRPTSIKGVHDSSTTTTTRHPGLHDAPTDERCVSFSDKECRDCTPEVIAFPGDREKKGSSPNCIASPPSDHRSEAPAVASPTSYGNSNGAAQMSWGSGSSRRLDKSSSSEHSFGNIDEEDLLKFFPEKLNKSSKGATTAKSTATQASGSSRSHAWQPRFSMRTLLSKLAPSTSTPTPTPTPTPSTLRPRPGSSTSPSPEATSSSSPASASSKDQSATSLHTMSSVIISHCGDSASHTVVAAFDATKKLTFEAVDWGLLQMDLWPGDTLVVLGVITKIKSPLGMDVLADINGFSGVNPRVLENEIAQRLAEYHKKLLARRLYCQKKGLNMEVRITAGHPLKNVVVKEARELQATWIILDRHLGGWARYFVQKSLCGLVLMDKKRQTGQLLRMSQQPSLTEPHYGGKYTSRQATTCPLSSADYHWSLPSDDASATPAPSPTRTPD